MTNRYREAEHDAPNFQPANPHSQAFARYQNDPAGYAHDILGVHWWERQQEVARALLRHRRVFVKASHGVGKSFLAGGLVNWFFDCFDPGLCITTAPNSRQVKDILWKEIRAQRPRQAREVLLPRACRMETDPEHVAVGYTARNDSGFQGRHAEHVLIVFDEATGVDATFWDAAEGMMTSLHCYWLAILNPTDTASRAYEECQRKGKWHVMEISALEHPNIAADLAGKPAPYPRAVRLEWVQGRVREWCTPVGASDRRAGDFPFPAGSETWYRPGPLFESRVLGRWPTQGSLAVWTEAVWNLCLARQVPGPVRTSGARLRQSPVWRRFYQYHCSARQLRFAPRNAQRLEQQRNCGTLKAALPPLCACRRRPAPRCRSHRRCAGRGCGFGGGLQLSGRQQQSSRQRRSRVSQQAQRIVV